VPTAGQERSKSPSRKAFSARFITTRSSTRIWAADLRDRCAAEAVRAISARLIARDLQFNDFRTRRAYRLIQE
jgi:hypothetical protein